MLVPPEKFPHFTLPFAAPAIITYEEEELSIRPFHVRIMDSSSDSISRQQLPEEEIENGQPCFAGFRFHPTEDESVGFYLHRRLHDNQTNFSHLIQDLDLYSHEAWDLPGLAAVGEAEREWFFFVSFASRLHNDGRPNRITPMGFWKTTGTDRPLYNQTPDSNVLAWKKTLVFYKGRAPRGQKTDWIMNEYRINHSGNEEEKEEDIRLCRVYKKKTLARSFDRRPTIHVDRPLHTGRPSTFEYKASASSSSHIETDSTQQQFTGLGQQSSDTMNEGAGMSYSSPQTEIDVELEELGCHNCYESVLDCNKTLTLQDVEAENFGSLSPLWHFSS